MTDRQAENYMHDYEGVLTEQVIAGRRAETHAAFFLPYIKSGMSLLDCGSGPGTITAGLAQTVAPGKVTGMDLEESQVQAAQRHADELGLQNVTFQQGDVYHLPFDDNTFDAAFTHAMLEHLTDPGTVVHEMHRVLKPGGIIGLRDVDLSIPQFSPYAETLGPAHHVWVKYRQHHGGDPFLGARLGGLLEQADFTIEAYTKIDEVWDTADRRQMIVSAFMNEFAGPDVTRLALENGWADQAQMEATARDLEAWGEHPEGRMAITWCEAIGQKG